jgi:hypothetical protein
VYLADGQATGGTPAAAPTTKAAAPGTGAATGGTANTNGGAAVERLASTSDIPVGGGKIFSADKVDGDHIQLA